MCGLKWYTDGKCDHTGLPSDGSKVSAENDGVGLNRSAKPDVLHSCAKSPAQTRTLAKRDSMCSEMCHELFHPTCKTLSAMPLTKVDDAERKRQGRAASPPERGRRSKRTP